MLPPMLAERVDLLRASEERQRIPYEPNFAASVAYRLLFALVGCYRPSVYKPLRTRNVVNSFIRDRVSPF